VASVATGLVVAIAGLVFWELFAIRGNRRQKRVAARNRSELERLRAEETLNLGRAQLNAARLQAVLDGTSDGIALFDSGLRLVQWNHPFMRAIGVEPRKDMPLDSLLREQAAAGLFGPVADVEAEIARRAGILRAGDAAGLPQVGLGSETLFLRGLPVAEGGFMLLLNGLTTWEATPLPPASTEVDVPVAPVPAAAAPAPIEW
jgi:PAS domain-containing protein